jgi:hypothetical protein
MLQVKSKRIISGSPCPFVVDGDVGLCRNRRTGPGTRPAGSELHSPLVERPDNVEGGKGCVHREQKLPEQARVWGASPSPSRK